MTSQPTHDEMLTAFGDCFLRVAASLSHRSMREALTFLGRDLAIAARPLSAAPADQALALVASTALERITAVIELGPGAEIKDMLAYLQALEPSGDLADVVLKAKEQSRGKRWSAPSEPTGGSQVPPRDAYRDDDPL